MSLAPQSPLDSALESSLPEEIITLEIPRSMFDSAKAFVKGFGQALEAADAATKASAKATQAQEQMGEGLGGLEGFGAELNAASQSGMGLPI